eukprot:14859514-Alexandrium_andersonii.AAC.1
MHDDPNVVPTCQACYICAKYHRTEDCQVAIPWSDSEYRQGDKMWAIYCPICSGNHRVEECQRCREERGRTPICE